MNSSDADQRPYEPGQVSEGSRLLVRKLWRRFPTVAAGIRMKRSEGDQCYEAYGKVPSPSGDPGRDLTIWMLCGDDPSLFWGDWHSHASLFLVPRGPDTLMLRIETFLQVLDGVFTGRFVLLAENDEPGREVLDVTRPTELHDSVEVSRKYEPDVTLRVLTWTGSRDRVILPGEAP